MAVPHTPMPLEVVISVSHLGLVSCKPPSHIYTFIICLYLHREFAPAFFTSLDMSRIAFHLDTKTFLFSECLYNSIDYTFFNSYNGLVT